MTRKLTLTLLSVFLSLSALFAQVSQRINVSQPGTLSQLVGDNKKTITDLTLTGTINDQDFQTFKEMTALKVLDMSAVDIVNKAIPAGAFANFRGSVDLPEGLESIGYRAFARAILSSELILPTSLKTLDEDVFHIMTYADTVRNKAVDFSKLVNLETISNNAFLNWQLGDIDLSKNLKLVNIGRSAFPRNNVHVTLPRNLKSLGTSVFDNFRGSVDLPEGLESIGYRAFARAILSSELILPTSLKTLDEDVFHIMTYADTVRNKAVDFSKLVNLETISNNAFLNWQLGDIDLSKNLKLVNIGRSAFPRNNVHVTLPRNLKSLGTSVFDNFRGSVDLPEGLESIGYRAFARAILSSELILPTSLKTLDEDVFHIMTYADTVRNKAVDFSKLVNLETISNNAFLNWQLGDIDLSNNLKLVNIGRSAFPRNNVHVTLPRNLKSLGTSVFDNFRGSVDLPEGLESIGYRAFARAILSSELILPTSLKTLDEDVFHIMTYADTVRNKAVDFSKLVNLETISNNAFLNWQLGDIDLSKNLKLVNIGRSAFPRNNVHVTLPRNLKSLGTSVFDNFRGSVDLPEGLESIGYRAFARAILSSELILPTSLKTLDEDVFHIMTYADTVRNKAVDFSKLVNLETISNNAFLNWQLGDIDLSNNLKLVNIGRSAFPRNNVHVTLPRNLKSLGTSVFDNFRGSVDLPEGLKTIGNNCFQNSTIKEITLPSTLKTIGANAFSNCAQLEKIVSNNPTPPVLGSNVFGGVNKSTCKLLVTNDKAVELYSVADQWKEFLVTTRVPGKVSLVYQEQRGDKMVTANYEAVRVGEYYWMNNNFNSPEYKAEKLPTGEFLLEGDDGSYYSDLQQAYNKDHKDSPKSLDYFFYKPNNKEKINKGFIDWGSFPKGQPDFWSYGVTMDEFNKYVGSYCTRSRIDYMNRYGKMIEDGKKNVSWKIPTDLELRQLVAMCGYGLRVHEVIQYLSYSGKEAGAPAMTKIENKSGGYWIHEHSGGNFSPNLDNKLPITEPFNSLNSNKYALNFVTNGSRVETKTQSWLADLQKLVNLEAGDYKQLGQVLKIQGYNSTLVLAEIPEMAYGYGGWVRPAEWHTVRWCRALTDEELGYKLYIKWSQFDEKPTTISDQYVLKSIGKTRNLHPGVSVKDIIENYAKIEVVQLGVNDPAPQGYVELPKGLIRAYYVQFMIDRSSEGHDFNDILGIAYQNINMFYDKDYNWGVDLIPSTRSYQNSEVEDATLSNVRIYPNPVENELNISSDAPISKVELYNTTGSVVFQQKDVTGSIDMSHFASGVYILKLQSGKDVQTHKILKK